MFRIIIFDCDPSRKQINRIWLNGVRTRDFEDYSSLSIISAIQVHLLPNLCLPALESTGGLDWVTFAHPSCILQYFILSFAREIFTRSDLVQPVLGQIYCN